MSSAKGMLNKVVIPVAGLGTRMLPFTKEQPKEMLPLFSNGSSGNVKVTPIVQMIFEQLYSADFREFCFIVGRGKRVIEDHFTTNHFLHSLTSKKNEKNVDIDTFYRKIENSRIAWINQAKPKGFGHAVLLSEAFSNNTDFLVHAGDVTIISSRKKTVVERMKDFHYRNDMDVTLCVKKISDLKLLQQHGITVIDGKYRGGFTVRRVVEKPARPASNLAIMPIYVFNPVIFRALKNTSIDSKGELQLTDAIQTVIQDGGRVGAIVIGKEDIRLDVGTPENYFKALTGSYHSCNLNNKSRS